MKKVQKLITLNITCISESPWIIRYPCTRWVNRSDVTNKGLSLLTTAGRRMGPTVIYPSCPDANLDYSTGQVQQKWSLLHFSCRANASFDFWFFDFHVTLWLHFFWTWPTAAIWGCGQKLLEAQSVQEFLLNHVGISWVEWHFNFLIHMRLAFNTPAQCLQNAIFTLLVDFRSPWSTHDTHRVHNEL